MNHAMDQWTTLKTYLASLTPLSHVVLASLITYIVITGPRVPRIFGRAKLKFYHADSSNSINTRRSLPLTLKDGTKTTFAKLCEAVVPPCNLNPFLFNGDLQTVWTAVCETESIARVYYKRWVFEQEDPTFKGQFAVDFVTDPYQEPVDLELPPRTTLYTRAEFEALGSDDSRPMLVTLHGLSGGSHELYLREVLDRLCTVSREDGGSNKREWEACVVNSRGCAQSTITSGVLYNARSTWDVRQAVKFLRKKFPNRPLFGCGFSLGANIITNYIGEEGPRCELKAAIVLSSPWNLEIGNRALRRTWIGLNIYSKAMGTSLRALFERHIEQLGKNPVFDIPAIRNLKYLHEFDYLVQCACWGYPTAAAYYRDAASSDALMDIRIPILGINAADDPIVSHEALPYEEMQETPYGVLCTTELGGHLSWFELGGGRWFATATAAFLQKMARDVDLNSLPNPEILLKSGIAQANGHANGDAKGSGRQPLKPIFSPTRRKWHVESIPEN